MSVNKVWFVIFDVYIIDFSFVLESYIIASSSANSVDDEKPIRNRIGANILDSSDSSSLQNAEIGLISDQLPVVTTENVCENFNKWKIPKWRNFFGEF